MTDDRIQQVAKQIIEIGAAEWSQGVGVNYWEAERRWFAKNRAWIDSQDLPRDFFAECEIQYRRHFWRLAGLDTRGLAKAGLALIGQGLDPTPDNIWDHLALTATQVYALNISWNDIKRKVLKLFAADGSR